MATHFRECDAIYPSTLSLVSHELRAVAHDNVAFGRIERRVCDMLRQVLLTDGQVRELLQAAIELRAAHTVKVLTTKYPAAGLSKETSDVILLDLAQDKTPEARLILKALLTTNHCISQRALEGFVQSRDVMWLKPYLRLAGSMDRPTHPARVGLNFLCCRAAELGNRKWCRMFLQWGASRSCMGGHLHLLLPDPPIVAPQ